MDGDDGDGPCFQGLLQSVMMTSLTPPINHRNERLNFPIPTKLKEPKKFQGWVVGYLGN